MLKYVLSLGIIGLIRLFINLCFTKLMFPQARIVRWPFYIRNEGTLIIGRGFSSNPGLVIDVYGPTSEVIIAEGVMTNYRLHIGAANKVSIGAFTLIGSDCLIIDHSHGDYSNIAELCCSPDTAPVGRKLSARSISIGRNCWLGDKVAILGGVSLGDGVVVGAGSVVTKSFPNNVMIAGSPAKIVKRYDGARKAWYRTSEN